MANAIRTGFDNSTYNVLMKEGYLKKLFDDTQREAIVLNPVFYKKRTDKDFWVLDQQMAGLDGFTELREGQNIPSQQPLMGSQKRYTVRRFGTGFRMTDMMLKYNKQKLWERWAKDLRKVMDESWDIELHVPFNSPTSTSLTCGTGFDSKALGANDHSGLPSGSNTYDNLLSAALSFSALETVRYYFKTKKDARGRLMSKTPTDIVFEPTLWPLVTEIRGSTYKPHENSNTINIMSDYLKPTENARLSSTTTWFVLCKDDDYDINVFVDYAPDFVTADAPDTSRDRICTSQMYGKYGWGNSSGIYIGNT